METLQASLCGRFLLAICISLSDWYEESLIAVLIRGGSALFRRVWAASVLGHMFSRESGVSRGWSSSLFCRGLSMLINLPGLLLRRLYFSARGFFDGSCVLRFGFAVVENTPIAVGWLMLVILIIPYKSWNNAYSLLGFGLMLVFAVLSAVRRKRRRLNLVDIGPYAVIFASFVFLAVPMSAYTAFSSRFLLYHLACMLCVLVIVSTVERASQLRRLAGMATLGMIVTSLYAFVQRAQGVDVNPSYVDLTLNKDLPGRVYSMFENPNAFAEVLVLLIPIALGLMLGAKSWRGRILGLVGVGTGSIAIIMTYSRASWVGLAVGIFLFVFLWKRKILPGLILLALAALPFLPQTVLNRMMTIFNFSDTSTASRFPLYEAGARLIADRPLQGAGLGSDAVRQAVTDLNFYHGKSPFVHCHNIYLQVWAETGLFGLVSFVGAAFWALKRGGSAALRRLGGSSARMMIIGSLSALLGIMVCGVADFIWHYPRVMLIFWFVFALAAASIRVTLAEERQKQRETRSLHE